MSIRFPFNEKKTAQAAAHLLRRHGGALNYMVLIKLLYLADREALVDSGLPITGDKPFSLPHGPVLSMVLDLVTMGRSGAGSDWFDYISEPVNYLVNLVRDDPEEDELSEYENGVLDGIDQKFGALNRWQLSDLTHELPEWEDPKGSSRPIELETILASAGKSPEEIEQITSEAHELSFFKSIGG